MRAGEKGEENPHHDPAEEQRGTSSRGRAPWDKLLQKYTIRFFDRQLL
jgi:hypothetical protein